MLKEIIVTTVPMLKERSKITLEHLDRREVERMLPFIIGKILEEIFE